MSEAAGAVVQECKRVDLIATEMVEDLQAALAELAELAESRQDIGVEIQEGTG